MANEEDWKELEKWAKEKKEAEIEKIGFDVNQIDNLKYKRSIKGINVITKGIKITAKIILVALIVFYILAMIYVYFWAKPAFEMLDVDLEGAISGKHKIELITVSKNTDKKGNETYIFSVKGHEDIQFNATKKYGNMKENYDAVCLKYCFDRWNSDIKNSFKLVERKENEMAFYDVYIEIKDESEIESAVSSMYDFILSTNGMFSPSWSLYIKCGESRIYPFYKTNMGLIDAIEEAKTRYKTIKN